jgi:transcriptional regulator with XRE-family HTH domain
MPPNRLFATSSPKFGALLRSWRGNRRFTLLQLALEARVSARHLGFLELGRAQPSRAMVLRLGEALGMPLRDQNVLLQAAGFAAMFPETELSAPEAANVRVILEMLLRNHEPFGAIALTHRWEVVMANRPQSALLSEFIGKEVLPFQLIEAPRPNLLRLLFEADGLRGRLVNWNVVARETLQRAPRRPVPA